MIQHILKQLWAQRKSNIWIFLELLVVGIFIWYIVDRAIVDIYTYVQPKGFDSSHIYSIKTDLLEPGAPGYVTVEESANNASEDLFRLMDQLRLLPGIESVCASFFSAFYARGNSNLYLIQDTATTFADREFHVRRVTPEFFDVFKIKSETGEPINSSMLTPSSTVITKDLKEILFGNDYAIGKGVRILRPHNEIESIPISTVTGVTTLIRDTEYKKATPCFFQCLMGPVLVEMVDFFGATRSVIHIRVSPAADYDFINKFLEQMGERTTVNNLYVTSIIPISEMRNDLLNPIWKEEKTRLSLVTFVLLNVLFGIIASFWLRTGYRRGEIALRMAVGANRLNIFRHLYLEAVCLLALTFIPVIIVALNIVYGGYIDIERLDFGFLRFMLGIIITYVILFVMIILGVWFPARRSASVQPAEALNYQ